MSGPGPLRVVIDTDPGLDDAVALLLAFRHPGLDVAAITTVAGNIGLPTTTRNAGRVAALARADVPVHPGADRPLARAPGPATAIHGADGVGGVSLPDPTRAPSRVAAVDALAAAVETGTTTLLCLGPLTNLATLIRDRASAARRLTRVIAMGGAVDGPGNVGPRAEFNLAHDPDAARAVLAAGLPLTLIPLDATRRLRADMGYVEALRADGSPAARATADLIAAYFAATDAAESRPLHDPCVPLMALRPDLFRCERRRLDVDLATGALVAGPRPVAVAMDLDAAALRDVLRAGLDA